MTKCNICGRALNQESDPLSVDCGGDCWGCVGEAEAQMGHEPSAAKVFGEIIQGSRPATTPEQKWLRARQELLELVSGEADIAYQIPGWEAVDEAMALRWLQSSIYEGFIVSFALHKTGKINEVQFSISEPEYE